MGKFVETLPFLIFTVVVYALCWLAISVLTVKHSHLTWKSLTALKKKRSRRQPSRDFYAIVYCTLGALFCILGFSTSNFMGRLFGIWNIPMDCALGVTVVSVVYMVSKFCMYTVLTARLHLAFKGSAYEYSPKTITFLYVWVSGTSLALVTACVLTGDGENVYTSGKEKHYICNQTMPAWVFGAISFLDVIYTVAFVTMFVRPLRKVLSDQKETGPLVSVASSSAVVDRTQSVSTADMLNNSIQRKSSKVQKRTTAGQIENLPVKTTLISSVATISTVICLMVSALIGSGVFVGVDTVINCTCLVLMTSDWQKEYDWLCGPLLQCIGVSGIEEQSDLHQDGVDSVRMSKTHSMSGSRANKNANSSHRMSEVQTEMSI